MSQNNIGLAFSFVNDEIGVVKAYEFNAIGSNKLDFGSKIFFFLCSWRFFCMLIMMELSWILMNKMILDLL